MHKIMAEIYILFVNCQGIYLFPKGTDVFNYLLIESILYTTYKTHTSVLELMKKWSNHAGIITARKASSSYLLKKLNIKFTTV